MRQTYQTSTGQAVHAIYAYNRLSVMTDTGDATFYVPQRLRDEASCTIRRKSWPRLSRLLDDLDADAGPWSMDDVDDMEGFLEAAE